MTDASFAQGLIGVELDGRYRLDAVLGEGGMGSVFRATQLALDRRVAVKLLKPHLTSDEAALQRFAREARATQKVDSPHAVKILDFGVTPLRDYYMVLEYLDGRTVQRELEIDGPFAAARVAHIARHALHALGVAHDLGLIHRDVKPDNLLLMRVGGDPDYTKILDFGVAKLMQGSAAEQLALTAAGMVFGTPEFMSPEQACGQPLDGRSDLYSLAATMFAMLTGQGLFEGKSAIEWLTHHARTPPPRLAMVRPELAAYPELDDFLQRCLAKSRDHRPATAAAMADQLAALEPTLQRPPGLAPAIADRLVPESIAGGPTPPARPRATSTAQRAAFSSSSYVRALEANDFTHGETLGVAGANVADTLSAAASSAELPPQVKRSRGLYYAGGGLAIAALIGLAFGISLRSRSTSMTPSMASSTSAPAEPPGPQPQPQDKAQPTEAAPVATAAPNDEGSAQASGAAEPPGTSGTSGAPGTSETSGTPGSGSTAAAHAPLPPSGLTSPASPAPPVAQVRPAAPVRTNPEAEEHLRAAEDALAGGNRIKQLVESQLALKADPRNVRAKFLAGDALIKAGDLDHGCAYLHALRRLTAARDRAHEAGCPDD
ncbi:MAG TPA: protein kinase [Kofleriaceae bacterium]|nr:protein kinase [Kofleriaceae bacterium]